MSRRRAAHVAAIVLVTAAYLGLSMWTAEQSRRQGVSSHSATGLGLDLFRDLLGERARPLARAFLDESATQGVATLVVASPRFEVSRHEAKTLEAFVERGGRLFVSFHDEESWQRVRVLASTLGVDEAKHDESFANKQTVAVEGSRADPLFPLGENPYELYGKMRFCIEPKLACYVRRVELGEGEAWVVASLPPFANALVARGGNREVAARLAALPGDVGFDEYHQLFSDKTARDLFSEPRVILPLLGLLAVVVLQLALGRAPRPRAASAVPETRSYHELGASLVATRLGAAAAAAEALARQKRVTARRFPDAAAAIERAPDAAALLALHHDLLLRLGRRPAPHD